MSCGDFSDEIDERGLRRLLRIHPVDADVITGGPAREVAVRGIYEITDRIGVSRQVYAVGVDEGSNVLVYNIERMGAAVMSNTCETMDLDDIVVCRRLARTKDSR